MSTKKCIDMHRLIGEQLRPFVKKYSPKQTVKLCTGGNVFVRISSDNAVPVYVRASIAHAKYGRKPGKEWYCRLGTVEEDAVVASNILLRLQRHPYIAPKITHKSPLDRAKCGNVHVDTTDRLASEFSKTASVEIAVLECTAETIRGRGDEWRVGDIKEKRFVSPGLSLAEAAPIAADAHRLVTLADGSIGHDDDDDISGELDAPDLLAKMCALW